MNEEIQRLEEKIDSNMNKIIKNMNRLHKHDEEIKNNSLKIKENSYALEILKDYKTDKKRLFKLLVISICLWLVTLGYLIYVLVK